MIIITAKEKYKAKRFIKMMLNKQREVLCKHYLAQMGLFTTTCAYQMLRKRLYPADKINRLNASSEFPCKTDAGNQAGFKTIRLSSNLPFTPEHNSRVLVASKPLKRSRQAKPTLRIRAEAQLAAYYPRVDLHEAIS